MDESKDAFRELERFLEGLRGKNTVIVGLGNTLRGDDAAGILVAKLLTRKGLKKKVIVAGPHPELYIKRISELKPDIVIFIDAIDAGLAPGAITLSELPRGEFRRAPVTTHALPLSLIVEMLGVKSYILGIQVENTEFNAKITREVRKSCQRLAELIAEKLNASCDC